jgi:hypothetical protein
MLAAIEGLPEDQRELFGLVRIRGTTQAGGPDGQFCQLCPGWNNF